MIDFSARSDKVQILLGEVSLYMRCTFIFHLVHIPFTKSVIQIQLLLDPLSKTRVMDSYRLSHREFIPVHISVFRGSTERGNDLKQTIYPLEEWNNIAWANE